MIEPHSFKESNGSGGVLVGWCVVCGGHPDDPIHKGREAFPIFDIEKLRSDDNYRSDFRQRFETDHFFAARVIGYNDFTEATHRPAVDLYFPKNRNIPIQDQSEIKKRIILDPRHTLKTSLKRVDRLQWIVAFPEDITILNQSATQKLAKEVAAKTADHFYQPRGTAPTLLQVAYPELVTLTMPDVPWNTGIRRRGGAGDMEYTLDYTSPQSTQSGWHPWIVDNDDVEDTNNSGISADPDVRHKVITTCSQNENLLRDGGYIFTGGTRYHPLDYYGKCLRLAELNPSNWKVLVRSSLTVKDGSRLMPGEFPEEEEVICHFPQFTRLRYKALREQFYDDYEVFMCQQQNDPMGGSVPKFDDRLFSSCLITPERVPIHYTSEVFICWRPQYAGKKDMERYTEGVAARILDGKVYILDAWQGVYGPSALAKKIVDEQRRHQANATSIIGVPGSDYIATHVRNEAARRNTSIRLQWLDYEDDDIERAKKMENLEPLMKVGRVLFSTGMRKMVECKDQFLHFGLTRENGIIECISRMADRIPLSSMRANMEEEELEHQRRRREDAMAANWLDQQGMPTVDEIALQRAKAHQAAMEKAQNQTFFMPPLPGGLDG